MKITVEQAMGKPELERFDGRLVSLPELFRKRLLRVYSEVFRKLLLPFLVMMACSFNNVKVKSFKCNFHQISKNALKDLINASKALLPPQILLDHTTVLVTLYTCNDVSF